MKDYNDMSWWERLKAFFSTETLGHVHEWDRGTIGMTIPRTSLTVLTADFTTYALDVVNERLKYTLASRNKIWYNSRCRFKGLV